MYRKILKNLTWISTASLLVKPAWLLFLVSVTPRLLGAHEYGILTAALALVAVTTSFADVGMAQYSLREIARHPQRASRHFTNFMLLRAVLLILGAVLSLLLARGLGYTADALLAVAFGALYWTTLNVSQYCATFYRAFEELHHEAVVMVIDKVLVIGLSFWLLWETRQASWTLAGMALGSTLTMFANVGWVLRRFAAFRRRLISPAFLRRSLRPMLAIGLAGFLTMVYLRTDAVMIEALLGETEAGQYGQAFRLLEALSLLPVLVQSALFPRLSALYHEQNYPAFSSLLRLGLGGLFVGGLVVTIPLSVFAPSLITLLVPDPAFAPSAGVLSILAWTFPLTCVQNLLFSALLAADRQRVPVYALFAAALFNLGLNAAAIPTYGIEGAALITVASELLIVAFYLAYFKRSMNLTHTPSLPT